MWWLLNEASVLITAWALLKADFGSRSQGRVVPDVYSTFIKKATLKSTLLDFKSGKSNLHSNPHWPDEFFD